MTPGVTWWAALLMWALATTGPAKAPQGQSPDAGALLARPATISADRFEVLNKEQKAEYTGHAKVVRDTLTMTCDRLIVEYDDAREITRILARGNVEAVDQDRWSRGDEADYDNRTGVLVVRGHPEARQGKREVLGQLVTFVNGSQRIVVTQAKTRVENATDGGPPDKIAIDADTLVLDETQSLATWSGHVKARRGITTMVAPKMTASYDEHGDVTRLQAENGVEATQGDKWARGQNADYDAVKGMLVVTGNPQAKQGANRMRGTKVIFYQGSDLLEVENVTSVIEVDSKKSSGPAKGPRKP